MSELALHNAEFPALAESCTIVQYNQIKGPTMRHTARRPRDDIGYGRKCFAAFAQDIFEAVVLVLWAGRLGRGSDLPSPMQ